MLTLSIHRVVILLLLVAISACSHSGKHTNINGAEEQRSYFNTTLLTTSFGNIGIEKGRAVIAKQQWQPIKKTQFEPVLHYNAYFAAGLKNKQTGMDSIAAIAQLVYACSNLGWMPNTITENDFLHMTGMAQYNAMLTKAYNAHCASISSLLVNTLSGFGYPAVAIKLGLHDTLGGYHKHVAAAAWYQGKWYVLEALTGQMMLDPNGHYLCYDKYLDMVANREASQIRLTAATYGKFMQPGPYKGQMQWVYGSEPDSITCHKKTGSYTIINTKRDIHNMAKDEIMQCTYLAAIKRIYGEPNWLYMYDANNIIQVNGSPQAQALFGHYHKP